MRQYAAFVSGRAVSRILIATLVGGSVVGCGSDVGRFDDNPFTNPFGQSQRFGGQTQAPQASAPQAMPPMGAPQAVVQAAPLPAPVASAPLSAPVAASAPVATRATGPVQPGWSAQGGTPVVLARGETLKMLSDRYGVPEAAIRSANKITGQPAPGTTVVIPVYNATGPGSAAPAQPGAPVTAAASVPGKQASVPVPPQAPATASKAPTAAAAAKTGKPEAQKPVQMSAIEATKPDPKAAKEAAKEAAKLDPKTGKPVEAKVDPKAAKAQEVAKADPKAAANASSRDDTTASVAAEPTTEFRWPARGRVIEGFGNKSGKSNDGINIAVPEGTPVKAAEGGVVAYAGNELKVYGNLVLIRHDNGYVTAYAHNGELKVKKGEQVKRGQVIATSGQTGNVSSPQIHFELRKGSTPIDPMEHLSSN
jgi:murein DD-endopeptidase MepM/ murein hydrolase activator NlpD